MRVGIVGSEAAKFTFATKDFAQETIWNILNGELGFTCDLVVSGACHLGGIDEWAIEGAKKNGIPFMEFPPSTFSWAHGYKQRNLRIVENSDIVVCITVRELPPTYTGMKFPLCYHCGTAEHVKSGGCWTVKQAIKQGKQGRVIVV